MWCKLFSLFSYKCECGSWKKNQKITSDIQAAGQTANRPYLAYQYAALSDNPEETYTHHMSVHTQSSDRKESEISCLSVVLNTAEPLCCAMSRFII